MIETLQQQRALPHSEESERAVLAAVILDPPLLPAVAGRLAVDDFYGERHQILYRAMLDLQEQGTTIDLRTLQARLEQRNQLEAVGGLGYLAESRRRPAGSRAGRRLRRDRQGAVGAPAADRICRDVSRDCLDGGVDAQAALASAEQAILALGEEAVRRGFVTLSTRSSSRPSRRSRTRTPATTDRPARPASSTSTQ